MVNLDDVCKWLMEQAGNYSVEVADAIENDIVPQLKKAMEEQRTTIMVKEDAIDKNVY